MSYIQVKKDFETICKSNGWNIKEILSPRREGQIVEKRRIIAKALRAKEYSYPKIGYAMNRDHSSIMNLVNPKTKKDNAR